MAPLNTSSRNVMQVEVAAFRLVVLKFWAGFTFQQPEPHHPMIVHPLDVFQIADAFFMYAFAHTSSLLPLREYEMSA